MGPLMQTATATMIQMAEAMERRNQIEEEKLKREKEKESKGEDQGKPRDPFREDGSLDSDGGSDFLKS